MNYLRRFVVAALLVVWAGASPLQAQAPAPWQSGPSFTCTPGQGVVETAVCASPSLSADDRLMTKLYAVDRVSAFGAGPSNMLVGQRSAVKDMQGCAKPAAKTPAADCLRDVYAQRISDLAVAAMIRSPDLALPAIRKFDPTYAPVLEAVAIWASEPANADWSAPVRTAKRVRIALLLRPAMTQLLTGSDNEFARSILTDSSDGPSVKTVDDLFKSPRHFAAFLNVIGAVLDPSPAEGRPSIPCAAIVRHPDLLDASASVFGSTLDNAVLNTDCAETLPPTPALSALDGKLRHGWPECEGTIRFAAYRTYALSLDSARLGITRHNPTAASPSRDGVTSADTRAARAELAAYYIQYLGKARPQAETMADDAIKAVMISGQECG